MGETTGHYRYVFMSFVEFSEGRPPRLASVSLASISDPRTEALEESRRIRSIFP